MFSISQFFSLYISLRSELSFKPLNVCVPPPSDEKIDIKAEKSEIFGQNFQNSKTPNSKKFARPEE